MFTHSPSELFDTFVDYTHTLARAMCGRVAQRCKRDVTRVKRDSSVVEARFVDAQNSFTEYVHAGGGRVTVTHLLSPHRLGLPPRSTSMSNAYYDTAYSDVDPAFLPGSAGDPSLSLKKAQARKTIAEEEIALAEAELRVKRLRLAKRARVLEKDIEHLGTFTNAKTKQPKTRSPWYAKVLPCVVREPASAKRLG